MAANCKKKKAFKLPKFISQEEVLRILDGINTKCWTGTRHFAVIMVLYRAGLRVSELCNLTLSDANFKTGMFYVQAGKGKKDRYVPMDDDVLSALGKWLEMRPESKYLFCTGKGDKLDQRYVRDLCYRLSEKAGVYIQDGETKKPVSPHKFRHSCFTDMLREGDFNIREIQQIAGHKNVNTTMIYTHVVMDELTEKFKNRKRITR